MYGFNPPSRWGHSICHVKMILTTPLYPEKKEIKKKGKGNLNQQDEPPKRPKFENGESSIVIFGGNSFTSFCSGNLHSFDVGKSRFINNT
jgi:stalled ribosome alternative rescue factor ArfA